VQSRSPSEEGGLVVFPAHALLIVEERLREQEAEGVQLPDMPKDELALRTLIAAAATASPPFPEEPNRREA
jgi:hypothetical protein